jgi:hypothetical protein
MMNVLACNLGWGFNELLPGSQVSKLGKMKCQDADLVARDVKADDLRQMFLAMTEEVFSDSSFLSLLAQPLWEGPLDPWHWYIFCRM